MTRVAVIVLGDLGHSPRMSYHALSLANNGAQVDLIGYTGSDLHSSISSNSNISVHRLNPKIKRSIHNKLFLVLAFFKIFFQFFQFFFLLLRLPRPDYLLLQNPPSIPLFLVAVLIKIIRKTRLVIDWHNLGFTILELRRKGIVIKLARYYEKFLGKFGDAHFCVSSAMKKFLVENFAIKNDLITVLYDRPAPVFKSLSLIEKHNFLSKISPQLNWINHDKMNQSFLTSINHLGQISRDPDSVLAISSTSWTPDEDFTPLFNAIKNYNQISKIQKLPKLYLIITGKGPLKEFFQSKMIDAQFDHVMISTPWLTSEDYPFLIGSADFGISLHQSSSGLDLPMKILDMFGCGVPVFAVDYNCINELVNENINGKIFKNEEDLGKLLVYYVQNLDKLENFKANILESLVDNGWIQNWNRKAKTIFGL
ncbi:hypothetical protein RCL1_006801 [Eukaryota sp. TZLM3-RCL]